MLLTRDRETAEKRPQGSAEFWFVHLVSRPSGVLHQGLLLRHSISLVETYSASQLDTLLVKIGSRR
jgi:hypothetical protein